MFKGSGVAIVTPFHEDGTLNEEVYIQLIEWHLANGTAAIITAGTTGESSTLTDEEHLRVIELAVKTVNHRVPVIAGTGSNDTSYAVWLSTQAAALGVDAVLLINPYYNKANKSGMKQHFLTILEALSVPAILYNVPSRTGQCIPLDVALELANHERVIGYKEASGDIEYLTSFASKMPKDFYLYSGNDDQVLSLLALGGSGVISVAANILPSACQEMCMSFLNGNVARARELQFGMLSLDSALFCEVSPVPIKEAMNLLGMNVGPCRLPLGPMEEENKNRLKQTLLNYGLEVKLCASE